MLAVRIQIDYSAEGVTIQSSGTPEATLQILHTAWVNTFMDVLKAALKAEDQRRVIGPGPHFG